jgi:uroporphyrinogen-III decarboxylase
MHDHAMTVAGVPARKYYWDAKIFVETYQKVADYYGIDIARPSADIYNFEIEGMGGKMLYGENAMPTIDFRDPLIKEPGDLLKLKTPDFRKDGRLPFALECIKLRNDGLGSFCGIFSMAVGLRSYPVLIKDMRKRPQFVHDLFTFIIDQVLIPFFQAQKDDCGITAVQGADAWASIPLLSVNEMKEWVVPFNQQLVNKAKKIGVAVTSGAGDYCEEDPEKFNIDVIHGAFDVQMETRGGNFLTLGMGNWHEYPLEPVRQYTEKYRTQGIKFAIRAGINARLLRDGPVAKIVNTIRRYIETFGHDHELSIWLANIPADTQPDHVHAAVAATHTFGKFPIAANLNNVKFIPPKRETFEEWKDKNSRVTV